MPATSLCRRPDRCRRRRRVQRALWRASPSPAPTSHRPTRRAREGRQRTLRSMPTATPLLAPTTPTTEHVVGGGVRIDVHDVGVTRNGHPILHDVNLIIEPGELVAIIGASGAGKSTLLDAIAGIRPPTSGTVHIDGVRSGEPSLRHLLGYVPQDDLIHRDLPVAATLRYAARLRMPTGTPTRRDRPSRRRHARPTRSHQPGDHASRRPQRRAAQADQHRRRAPHPPSGLLPRRAHLGTRSSHGGEPHRHAAPPRRPGHHRSCSPPTTPTTSGPVTASSSSPPAASSSTDPRRKHSTTSTSSTWPTSTSSRRASWSSGSNDHAHPALPSRSPRAASFAPASDRPGTMTQWIVLAWLATSTSCAATGSRWRSCSAPPSSSSPCSRCCSGPERSTPTRPTPPPPSAPPTGWLSPRSSSASPTGSSKSAPR